MAYGTTHIPDTAAGRAPRARRRFRFGNLSDHFLLIASLGAFAFLYAPILVLIIFSFNDNPVTVLPLRGFTLGWYEKAFANADMMAAILNSFYVGFSAVALCLLIGVPAAFALDRYEFRGKVLFRRFSLLPITLPGIITGIAMMNMFRAVGMDLSLFTVILGHGTALTAVVITQVFARLQRFNRTLEEASSDLGGRPWQTFMFVTLPNIRSAIIGSSLLSFTLSFDEIPVTFFLTGRENTLPMYIYSTIRRGITPEINAIGTLIVVASLALILISVYLLQKEE
ncbi:MAG: ABC transporter permease [Alphaproteobacteria bacterium]|nr:MAG: ABC transporter permease [Alphaproteobacteria bacterium]